MNVIIKLKCLRIKKQSKTWLRMLTSSTPLNIKASCILLTTYMFHHLGSNRTMALIRILIWRMLHPPCTLNHKCHSNSNHSTLHLILIPNKLQCNLKLFHHPCKLLLNLLTVLINFQILHLILQIRTCMEVQCQL